MPGGLRFRPSYWRYAEKPEIKTLVNAPGKDGDRQTPHHETASQGWGDYMPNVIDCDHDYLLAKSSQSQLVFFIVLTPCVHRVTIVTGFDVLISKSNNSCLDQCLVFW